MTSKPFPKIGRYILIAWVGSFFYLPGLNQVLGLLDPAAQWYWFDIATYLYHQALFISLLVILVLAFRIDWHLMFGRFNKADFAYSVKLTAFVIVFSIATAYALFYPLSYLWTGFVEYWFIDVPPVIYSSSGRYPFLPNLMSFISLVVLAPVSEEFAFRGLLLSRWKEKWGLKWAIVISSVVFGILHTEPIGATAFGMAMCVLYLKTRTLLVPIICHALNNFVAWLFQAGYLIAYGSDFIYTLERFRNEWFIGAICGLIVFVGVFDFVRKSKTRDSWRLPEV